MLVVHSVNAGIDVKNVLYPGGLLLTQGPQMLWEHSGSNGLLENDKLHGPLGVALHNVAVELVAHQVAIVVQAQQAVTRDNQLLECLM